VNGANNSGAVAACKARKRPARAFAARLPNLLLFLAFIAYLTRSAAGLPAEAAPLPAGGATRALRCGAPRPINGHLPPFLAF